MNHPQIDTNNEHPFGNDQHFVRGDGVKLCDICMAPESSHRVDTNNESRKYTFPEGTPDVLGVQMTYEEFIDALTDAWIEAEHYEGSQPTMFRRALFYGLDVRVAKRKAGELS